MAKSHERLSYLDGVRGWAAVAVLIGHATASFFGGVLPAARSTEAGLLNDGALAVNVFFVLSGVVLTYPLLRHWDRARLQRMAFGRYVRLAIPILLTSAIGYAMLSTGLMHNGEIAHIIPDEWVFGAFSAQTPSLASLLQFSLYDAFASSAGRVGYSPFIWTMPVELCGSYFLFGALALTGEDKRLRLLTFGAGAVACQVLRPLYAPFFCGALLAELLLHLPSRRGAAYDAAGLALLAVAWAGSTFFRGRVLVVMAACVVLAAMLSPTFQRLMRCRLSLWLGAISFPLYLVHAFVLYGPTCWLTARLYEAGATLPQMFAVVPAATVAMSLLLAWLMRPIEDVAQDAAHRVGAACVSLRLRPLLPERFARPITRPGWINGGKVAS